MKCPHCKRDLIRTSHGNLICHYGNEHPNGLIYVVSGNNIEPSYDPVGDGYEPGSFERVADEQARWGR